MTKIVIVNTFKPLWKSVELQIEKKLQSAAFTEQLHLFP